MRDDEIRDLIQNLSEIGQTPQYEVVVSIVPRPNELLMTNVKDLFLLWKKKWEYDGLFVNLTSESYGLGPLLIREMDKTTHKLLLRGELNKIEMAYEVILSWKWVNSEKTKIESKKNI